MPKDNKNKKSTIILTIIGLVIVLIIALVIVIQNKLKEADANEPQQPQEIVLNDELKEKLANHIYELSYGSYCDIPTSHEYSGDCIYRNDVTKLENLSVTGRVYSLVLAKGSKKDNNKMVGTIIVNGHSFTNPNYVNYDEVEKEYHEIYGKNEKFYKDTINNISYDIKYDEDRAKYFYIDNPNNEFVRTYVEAYEKSDNEVFVYVRIGYVTTKDFSKYIVYRDRNQTGEITTLTKKELEEYSVVNSSNYQKFYQYKFYFLREAETNNLIFRMVERAK